MYGENGDTTSNFMGYRWIWLIGIYNQLYYMGVYANGLYFKMAFKK